MWVTNFDEIECDSITATTSVFTNQALSWNTTIWDSTADTLTINWTTTINAPVTVWVDWTWKDVKFFWDTSWKYMLWDESADKLILTGTAEFNSSVNIAHTTWKITSTASATTIVPFIPVAVQQALSWAGAVTLTEYNTALTTTWANALTLADSTVIWQVKKIQMIVDGWEGTLTFNTTATIVFADVWDTAELMWNGTIWIPIALYNIVDWATAPAYTPAS